MKRLTTVFLLWILVGAPAARAQQQVFKPEDSVRFPKGGIACLSQDGLHDLLLYSLRGERTKAASMMIGSGDPQAECVSLEPARRYKIISAEFNDAEHPDIGLIEIVGQGVTSRNGAWTLSIAARPVTR